MSRKLASALTFLCFLMFFCVNASASPLVSYTTSGSPGNWTLDFSVTNTLGGGQNGIYLFGVKLSDHNSTAWPNGWTWNYDPNSVWNNEVLGGSNTKYNMGWQADHFNGENATSILKGQTLSGFMALVTSTDAPTSVPWFAFATYFEKPYYDGTDAFSGNMRPPGQFDFDNPGFEGIAHHSGAPVPEPATMLLLASGLVGLAGLRKRFKKN